MFVKARNVSRGLVLAIIAMSAFTARAELVLDDEIQAAAASNALAADEQRTNERENTRDILRSSEKQKATQAAQELPVVQVPMQTANVPQIVIQQAPTPVAAAPAPISQPAAVAVEVQNLSKSEMLRRERVREELRNEDVLQERLEQLRLRDEQRRTEQLVGGVPVSPVSTGVAAFADASTQTGVQTVIAPITERPGDSISTSQAAALAAPTVVAPAYRDDVSPEPSLVRVSPRAGLANMKDTLSYVVNSRYSAGLGMGVEVSKNLSFELGYTFTEFGVITPTNSLIVQNVVAFQTGGFGLQNNIETMTMKQNVVDTGLKLHFLSRDAKLRPFVGGGAGYAKSFINLDQSILAASNTYYPGMLSSKDYRLSQVLGYLSAGFDVSLSRNISVGAVAKYSTVMTSRENQQLGTAAYNAGWYNPWGFTAEDAQKLQLGGSVARSSFYSISGGVTFAF